MSYTLIATTPVQTLEQIHQKLVPRWYKNKTLKISIPKFYIFNFGRSRRLTNENNVIELALKAEWNK